MKLSEAWLREWVNPPVDITQLTHQLTMAGLEVDSVEPCAAQFSGVVVGLVVSVEPHPNADRLRICRVDVGEKEPLQIVCGASNVAAGQKVPAALIGASFESGLKIKKSKLRDVESYGMLCSAVELGLAQVSEGLMLLPIDAPVGQDIRELLQLDDRVIEIDLTPNRGDCLSVAGIAREVAAINQLTLNKLALPRVEATISDELSIHIKVSEACPRYVGRIIKNINVNAVTPLWMVERLRRSGIREINPAVDVMNYVMLAVGQPMHAFDLDTLEGGIIVRLTASDEKIRLLDEREISLQADTLVIADNQQALAVAGIMGGIASSVTDKTRHIFLESAFFAPKAVAGHARQYGMSTDSSHRFERGVDPLLQRHAIELATSLLIEIVGGDVGPVCEASAEQAIPRPSTILLRTSRVARLLGIVLSRDEIKMLLLGLHLTVEVQGDDLLVTPPSYRFDLNMEIDLIEEVARMHGYDNIQSTRPQATITVSDYPEACVPGSVFTQALCNAGYHEAVTYSFVDNKVQQLIDPHHQGVPLVNPISSEMSVMRTTLLAGLLPTIRYNQNRQQDRVRLFETGLRFVETDSDTLQEKMIAGAAFGPVYPTQWGEATRPIDFYDIKGDVESLLGLTRDSGSFSFVATQHPALHPGQAADIVRDGQLVGFVGLLNPKLTIDLDLQGPIAVFEMRLDLLEKAVVPVFGAFSKFPEIKRDLAFIINDNVLSETVLNLIQQAAGPLLKNTVFFDIYKGKGIPAGQKSVAVTLVLQDLEKTLIDDEVTIVIQRVTDALRHNLSATLRA